jgi:ketosteroid isomerase-like protein
MAGRWSTVARPVRMCPTCVRRLRTAAAQYRMGVLMLRLTLTVACLIASLLPAFAQKAEIEAVTAKWLESFNKGDFAGVASLYTEGATALPPGSSDRSDVENIAGQASDPQITTLDFKSLGPSAAREIGTYSLRMKDPPSQELTGKYLVGKR